MTERDFLIGIAVVAFALGTLALWLAVRSVLRRRRARQRQARVGLIFRGILITLLFALGVASLRGAPPPDLVNRPAPSDVGAVVAFVQNTREGESRTIQAVSARDGVTRWTHRLNGAVKSLLSPTAGIILAQMYDNGFYALRTSDGSVIWSYGAGLSLDHRPGGHGRHECLYSGASSFRWSSGSDRYSRAQCADGPYRLANAAAGGHPAGTVGGGCRWRCVRCG